MQNEYSQKWDKCLEIIQDIIPAEQFKSWFSPLTFRRVEGDMLTISCPTEYFAEQLEERYINVLGKTLKRVFGSSIRLTYEFPVVANDPASQMSVGSAHPSQAVKPMHGATSNPFKEQIVEDIDSQLNPDYTFENYCISPSNKVARSIGEAIANDPKLQTFNPLFVFGPCGVGKTHLIQAIGIRIKEQNPRARVLYITARIFESQYTAAVPAQQGQRVCQLLSEYRHPHYRRYSGFHRQGKNFRRHSTTSSTTSSRNHRQLIMSSDCSPSEMEGMQDRLLAFQVGYDRQT